MVDYQSHYGVPAKGFTSTPPRAGVKTLRELYHEEGRKIFRKRHDRPVHDCRHEIMKDHTDRQEFETWILSHGLIETYRAVEELHDKSREPVQLAQKSDKLLYKIGELGQTPGDFRYPRGICTTMRGEILVADSKNHRIQHFSQFGIYLKQVGHQGSAELEFDEPSDVIELPNGDVAVADKKNKQVQVLTEDLQHKYSISIPGEPYSLGFDKNMNVAVGTTNREVHIFHLTEGSIKHSFPVGSKKNPATRGPVHISMTMDSEIAVSDPEDGLIYKYTIDGQQLDYFRPKPHTSGLSVVPGGLCVTPLGQILVVDTLNHGINLYSKSGGFLQQVLSPTDFLGNVHSLALGWEGHLVLTDFSVGGDHCVKVLRYRQCPCHERKATSIKKRSTSYFQ